MYTVYTRIMCFVLTEKKGESMNRRVDSSEEKPNNKRKKSGNDNIQSYNVCVYIKYIKIK